MIQTISRFRGEYKFLSNFAEVPFEFEGHTYPSVEHAYQERKTLDPERRELIRNAKTPLHSAILGRAPETIVRDGWLEGLKAEVMRELVFAKFQQNPDIADKLMDTEDAMLMEGNYWHDNYFGVCTCRACHDSEEQPKNMLGVILMDVRESLMQDRYEKSKGW